MGSENGFCIPVTPGFASSSPSTVFYVEHNALLGNSEKEQKLSKHREVELGALSP